MFKSVVFLVVLIFSTYGAVDCATRGVSQCASDPYCRWEQGSGSCQKFTATDCSTGSCAEGCTVVSPVLAACVDLDIEVCAIKTDSSCLTPTGTESCVWSAGTCSNSASAQCGYDGSGNCPNTCEENVWYTCEKIPGSSGGSSGGGSSCTELNTNTISECAAEEYCTVSGSSCTGGEEGICSSFSTTRAASKCSINSLCQVQGSSCVVSSACPAMYQQIAALVCPAASTAALTACDLGYNCKVSGTGATATCRDKTPNEICSEYSVALEDSECTSNYCCKANGASCGADPDSSSNSDCAQASQFCSSLSTTLSVSECSQRECVVDGEQCRAFSFNCAAATNEQGGCNSEANSHDCSTKENKACVDKDCGAITTGTDCDGSCVWSAEGGNCITDQNLDCASHVLSPGGCDSSGAAAGCTSTPYVAPACNVPSLPETTCTSKLTDTGCEGVSGCKWVTAGGTCVAAGVNPPGDGTLVIYSHFVLMAVIILLLF